MDKFLQLPNAVVQAIKAQTIKWSNIKLSSFCNAKNISGRKRSSKLEHIVAQHSIINN